MTFLVTDCLCLSYLSLTRYYKIICLVHVVQRLLLACWVSPLHLCSQPGFYWRRTVLQKLTTSRSDNWPTFLFDWTVDAAMDSNAHLRSCWIQVHKKFYKAIRCMGATLKCPEVWQPCIYMFVSHNLSLDIQGGMFYWYTDPVVGPGFSEVSTLTRYHQFIQKRLKARNYKHIVLKKRFHFSWIHFVHMSSSGAILIISYNDQTARHASY